MTKFSYCSLPDRTFLASRWSHNRYDQNVFSLILLSHTPMIGPSSLHFTRCSERQLLHKVLALLLVNTSQLNLLNLWWFDSLLGVIHVTFIINAVWREFCRFLSTHSSEYLYTSIKIKNCHLNKEKFGLGWHFTNGLKWKEVFF